MYCSNCGRDVPDDSAYCAHCGARLADSEYEEIDSDVSAGAERLQPGSGRGGREPAEDELWNGTYSPKAMVGSFIAAAILTVAGLFFATLSGPVGWIAFAIGVAVVWVGLLMLLAYRRLTVRYRLTTFRFFHELGLLSRFANRIEVIDIDDVNVRQGLVERLFGVGTIHISSSDKTDPELDLPGIDDARQVADLIDGTRRAERHRRGLHIETI